MQYPYLRPAVRKRILIDRFRGYEHRPVVSAGAFYDMENLSGARSPLLRVRPRREEVRSLDGSPTTGLLAIGGRGAPVILDRWGTLWCGGNGLPRLLEGSILLSCPEELVIADRDQILRALTSPGSYRFRYGARSKLWYSLDGGASIPGSALTGRDGSPEEGFEAELRYQYDLLDDSPRDLVFLGGWVCIFPEGRYVNTVRLRQGQILVEGEDYGSIAQENLADAGSCRFLPCAADGTELEVVYAAQAPAGGYWVDSSAPDPVLRAWDQGQAAWVELRPYVKCLIPGIAKFLRAGDGVELFCHLEEDLPNARAVEALWAGQQVLTAAWHDPGDQGRPEGSGDYLVFSCLSGSGFSLSLSGQDRSYFRVSRPMPAMDYVVEAANRLWGCRRAGDLNELYGCKLGDFRNWCVFEGLSTDSYRVSRGHDGPYTGAAVLGGCPLFFRADSLEKLYPDSGGAHGVTTVALSGIEYGSARSAVVLGDSLYYKSPQGVCRYNGTLPVLVSKDLGALSYERCAAGVLGNRVYMDLRDQEGLHRLFVLDTETGLWYREDGPGFVGSYCYEDRLYLLRAPDLPLLCVGSAEDSTDVAWYAETGDLIPRMGTRRYVSRMQINARLEAGAELRILLSHDGGPWVQAGEFRSQSTRSVTYPVFPRRCDRLRLRLEGRGGMELNHLSWLTEAGSDV